MQITKEEFNLKNPTEARKLLLELYNVGRKLANLKENIDSNNVKKMRELLVEAQRLCSYTGLKKGGEVVTSRAKTLPPEVTLDPEARQP